jgi:hypothetical protein
MPLHYGLGGNLVGQLGGGRSPKLGTISPEQRPDLRQQFLDRLAALRARVDQNPPGTPLPTPPPAGLDASMIAGIPGGGAAPALPQPPGYPGFVPGSPGVLPAQIQSPLDRFIAMLAGNGGRFGIGPFGG